MSWIPKNENSPFYSLENWWNNRVRPRIVQAWKDYTGVTSVDKQNQAQLELAKYQTQVQEDMYNKYSSPEALMRQYREAGLNPNLVYGSASAGQSNVPSFNAPSVQRNLSGSEKINKALSLVSAISGVLTGVYQASAAREAAQQSAVKTMSDIVGYKRNALDYGLQSDLLGRSVGVPNTGLFRKRLNGIGFVNSDLYNQYIGAYRESQFNKFADPVLRNYFDYGTFYDKDGKTRQSNYMSEGLSPYMFVRNRQAQLKYSLMDELGNMGTYGKLAVSLLGTIF